MTDELLDIVARISRLPDDIVVEAPTGDAIRRLTLAFHLPVDIVHPVRGEAKVCSSCGDWWPCPRVREES